MDAPRGAESATELEARILKRFEKTVRLALRYPAGVPAKVLTALRGGAIWRVLGCPASASPRSSAASFPRWPGSRAGPAAACAGQTAHNAKEALVALGFVHQAPPRSGGRDAARAQDRAGPRTPIEIHMPPEGSLGNRILGERSIRTKIERAKCFAFFF